MVTMGNLFLILVVAAMATLFMSSALSSSSSASNAKRVALVTGANKGIGKEIARKLVKDSNTTCLLGCRDEKLGQAALQDLVENDGCNGDNLAVVKLDLTDVTTMESARNYIEEKYDGQLDILVNNAAICFNDPTLYGKVKHTSFQDQADVTVRTNFFGTSKLTQTMLPLLKQSTSPRTINIASSAGRLSILPSQERQNDFSSKDLTLQKLEGYMNEFVTAVQAGTHASQGWPNTCYGASKCAIIAMTKILAREYPKIQINSVDPGYCATDQNNNQGYIPAERGAVTPFLLATLPDTEFFTSKHWFQEQEIQWWKKKHIIKVLSFRSENRVSLLVVENGWEQYVPQQYSANGVHDQL